MNILMLTPYLPYPLYSGGQIRSYNLLKHLSAKHNITLFSFIRSETEKQFIPKLKEFCTDVKVFVKRPPWSLRSLLLSAVTVNPLVVCMYLKKELTLEIEKATFKNHFDLIHAETFYVMPNIPQNNIPVILVEQTIEYLVYKHYTETVKIYPLKQLMEYDVSKILYWEKEYWKKATRVVAMSEADRNEMKKVVSKLQVDLVPNGVEPEFFSMNKVKNKNKKIVLFVGNFKWLQNREAVSILIREIWPIIQKKLPDVKLWIVGRFPPKEIINLSSKSITVSSNLYDIRDAYKNSDVLLAPIYGPGGTRYKILESMASGLPVVTTPTGIEGIGAKIGRDVLVSNNVFGLAKATIKLLTDQKIYESLSKNSRNLVKTNFNWKNIANSLDRIYKEAAYEEIN
jgi:polysaccharide biosynthesis protein PslH